MKNDKNKFNIQGDKPKVSELNKKLIITVVAIIFMAIILSFISSINKQNEVKHSHNSDIKANKSLNNPKFGNNLNSYKDNELIYKKLHMGKKPIPKTNKIDEELKNMILNQKNQLQRLQYQIQQLKMEKATPPPRPIPQPIRQPIQEPMNPQALNSSIFFEGGQPKPIINTNDSFNNENFAKNKTASNSGKNAKGDQQQEFMYGGKVNKDITNENTVQKPISKNIILAGTTIPAILQSKIVSSLPGMIVARVSQDVFDSLVGQILLIPRGSTLIGQYNSKTVYGDTSVQVKFIRLIRPNGTSIVLPNQQGVNDSGVSGLQDNVDNHWMQLFSSAALSAVFNLPAAIAQQQNSAGTVCTISSDGTQSCTPNIGQNVTNSALQSMGQVAQQVGGKLTTRAMNLKPTITIDSGKTFSILVTKDIYLPPYSQNIDNNNDD